MRLGVDLKYTLRINKRIKNVRVYRTLKKASQDINIVTKLFIRIFNPPKKEEG